MQTDYLFQVLTVCLSTTDFIKTQTETLKNLKVDTNFIQITSTDSGVEVLSSKKIDALDIFKILKELVKRAI